MDPAATLWVCCHPGGSAATLEGLSATLTDPAATLMDAAVTPCVCCHLRGSEFHPSGSAATWRV